MFLINGLGIKKIFLTVLILELFTILPLFAQGDMSELDNIRSELACFKDKNSSTYIKTREKLQKAIKQNKIDYSTQARLLDIQRLIDEQKYNCAVFELNDLIENNQEVSKSYELLADVYLKSSQTLKKVASAYKEAIRLDNENISAKYKLARLYLKESKNILGIELLKEISQESSDTELLVEIKNLIRNKIVPQDKYEANILYEILGQIYAKENKLEDSFHAFNKALQLNPNDIYIKYHLGDLFFNHGIDMDAQIVYDSILAQNSKDSQIRISKAKLLVKKGNLLSAHKEYLTILKDYPNSKQAKYGIYKIYQNKLNPKQILEKVYANENEYEILETSYFDFAKLLREFGEEDGALAFENYIAQIKETQKQKIVQHFDNVPTNVQDDKKEKKITKKQETIKKQQIIKKENPKKTKIKQKISQSKKEEIISKESDKKIDTKKTQVIEEITKQSLAQDEKIILQEKERAIAKDYKKYQQNQEIIKKYLQIEPKTSQIYIAIANTYKQTNENTNALKYYKEAQKLDPTNSEVYYNLGLTYLELNSPQTAKYNLERAINLDNENTKAQTLLSFVNQQIVTQIINKAHDNFENKKFIEAYEILDEGIKKYPQNAQLYYYRALVCDSMNRNAAQIMDLQKAIELNPAYYMAYYQLGNAYEKIKDEKNALISYERFLSIEPDEKELIEEIQKKVISLGAKYY